MRICIFLCVALLLTPSRSFAHHSLAEYDVDRPVTLDGTVVKLEWMNPHGWVYLEVKDRSGKPVVWAIQTAAPNALLKQGIQQDDFKVGRHLVITGYPAKNGTPKAAGRIVKLPDGSELFIR